MIKSYYQTLKKYKFLIGQLVNRDFKVKYKRSILGVFWSVLNPLFTMLIMNFVFKNLFGRNVDHFTLYLFSGLLFHNYMSDATNSAMISITSNFKMINKVYIPKYLFPFTKILSSLINFGITFIVFLIFCLFEQVFFSWYFIFVIYLIPCFLMFVYGLGLILSALLVFFRDLKYLYGVILTAWMYATPIMYPIDMLPESVQAVLRFNPMYQFVDFFRKITIYNEIPSVSKFISCFICGIIPLILGLVIFKKTQKNFIYYA